MQFLADYKIKDSSAGKNDLLMQTTEERLARNLQHSAGNSDQEWIFIGRLR